MKLGIIVAKFNEEMTAQMLKKAEEVAASLGMETVVRWVPGVYDMPLQIKKLLPEVNAIALLGVVKKGATAHDVVVAENTARLAADLSLEYGKPITLGIIGPDATLDEARERLDDYAERAVKAADFLVAH